MREPKTKLTHEERAAKAKTVHYRLKNAGSIIGIITAILSFTVVAFFFLVMTAGIKSCSGI
ncbi:MAG: hypothetical protein FWD49_01890 [Firmicutes bacterium]|nr:hypothetical protein [Bacillota bacterium]